MKKTEDSILYKKIKNIYLRKVKKTEDSVYLAFDKEVNLAILNKYSFVSKTNKDISTMKDVKVLDVIESDEEAKIIFEDGILTVDLRDEAYDGPEAMVLHGPNNLIVVWN